MEYNELTHHGIKGQKWGVRRFQTKSGGLTSAGKKRYGVGKDASKSDKESTKKVESAKSSVTKSKKEKHEVHEDYVRAHTKKPVSALSDKELREINNRLQAEKMYNDLNPKKKSLGRKFLDDFILPAAKDIGREYTKKYMKEGVSYLEKTLKEKSADTKTDSAKSTTSSGNKNSKNKNKNKSSSSTPSVSDTLEVFKGMRAKMSQYAPQTSLGETFVAGLLEPPKN